MPLEKSAGAVIFRKERGKIFYLLLLYDLGHWDFAKGNIERGENLEGTTRREVEEETGIKDIKFITGFKETIKYFYKRDDQKIFKVVVFFLAETKTKDIKISYEHKDSKWLPYRQALKQTTFDNAKKILKKANDFLRGEGSTHS